MKDRISEKAMITIVYSETLYSIGSFPFYRAGDNAIVPR